jgi:alpha-L-fucosidase
MSLKEVIDMLVNVVDRGGNILLNVGPGPDGVIPFSHVKRLKEVGRWLAVNGEGIYGTRPGPFQPIDDYYGSTHKENKIFVHLVKLPENSTKIKLPAIDKKIVSCKILGGKRVRFSQDEKGIALFVTPETLNPVVTTFALETK